MTSDDEDEFIAPGFYRDDWLPHIQAESVGDALIGFPLEFVPGKNLGWLATAVRRTLAYTMPTERDDPSRIGNAEIRDALDRLGRQVQSLWVDLFELPDPLDSRLWDYAFEQWKGVNALTAAGDESFAYNRYKVALSHLDWLAGFLKRAAMATPDQQKNWRQSAKKELRILRGYYLAPIFEAAFGKKITVNNCPSDPRHDNPTPFMVFFSRMTRLAFGQIDDSNLSEVLKMARKWHKREPADFSWILTDL